MLDVKAEMIKKAEEFFGAAEDCAQKKDWPAAAGYYRAACALYRIALSLD